MVMTVGSVAQNEIAIEIFPLPFVCLMAIDLLARILCLVLKRLADLLVAGALATNFAAYHNLCKISLLPVRECGRMGIAFLMLSSFLLRREAERNTVRDRIENATIRIIDSRLISTRVL